MLKTAAALQQMSFAFMILQYILLGFAVFGPSSEFAKGLMGMHSVRLQVSVQVFPAKQITAVMRFRVGDPLLATEILQAARGDAEISSGFSEIEVC